MTVKGFRTKSGSIFQGKQEKYQFTVFGSTCKSQQLQKDFMKSNKLTLSASSQTRPIKKPI